MCMTVQDEFTSNDMIIRSYVIDHLPGKGIDDGFDWARERAGGFSDEARFVLCSPDGCEGR
jgi:hypothetical protein